MGALTTELFTLFNEHHGLNDYDAEAASALVPATAYGLQNAGMAMMRTLSHDMLRLLVDVPALLRAPNMGAASASSPRFRFWRRSSPR